MQRMKQLAIGAFSMALATAGIAQAAGDEQQEQQDQQDQGGRNAQPAPRTGSGAPSDTSEKQSDTSKNQRGANQGAGTSPSPATHEGSSSAAQGSKQKSSSQERMKIEQAQRTLSQRGLYHGAIDGMSGPQTMEAVRQFQQQQGMPVSGQLDDATRQALGIQLERQPVSGAQASSSPELEPTVGREGGSPGVTGTKPMRSQIQLDRLNQDQLRTLQTRLSELGFYRGPVDGVLGEGTRSALRQFFQTQADLASRGIITDASVSVFGFSPQGLNPPMGNNRSGTPPSNGSQMRNSESGTSPSGTSPDTRGGATQPNGTNTPRQGSSTQEPTNPSQGTR